MTSWNHDHAPANWTDERIVLLRKYWVEDGYTASKCASLLGEGVTRNSVLSKVHRLKLPKRIAGTLGLTWTIGESATKKTRSDKGQHHHYPRRIRKSQPVENDVPRPTPVPEFEVDLEALKAPAWAPLEGTTPITLLQTNDHTCKWSVLPDSPTAMFCGDHTAPGSPYCAVHKQRARGIGTIGEREAVKISKKLRLVGV